jgi:hypothetical protein
LPSPQSGKAVLQLVSSEAEQLSGFILQEKATLRISRNAA